MSKRGVLAVDGKQWDLTVDRTDCVVRIQTGNARRLPDWEAFLSPSDARQLAAALLSAADDLDRAVAR